MQTIKITTDNIISIIDVDFDDFKAIQKAINCDTFELVKTQQLWNYFKFPIYMVCDEEAHVKANPPAINDIATLFYNSITGMTQYWPILGDIIFTVPQGEDLLGLDDTEKWIKNLKKTFPFLREEE